jgi:hypothetical protein
MPFSQRSNRASKSRMRPWVEPLESRIALASVISLEVNNTAAKTDDLTLYNPPSSTEPFVQTVPMKVTNTGPAVELKLVVMPAGAVTFSTNTLTLQAKASAEVVITPASVSKAVDDITIEATVGAQNKVEGSEKMTDVSVIVPPHVRNSDTPAAMRPDRIPPRTTTKLPVMVTPDLGNSGLSITVAITGQSADNGMLTINGGANVKLTKTSDVDLVGTAQTAPTGGAGGGNAGKLALVAQVRGQNTVQSAGFSVAAIPQNWTITFDSLITGDGALGIVVSDKWESDSGNVADLNAAEISEQVQPGEGTGTFMGFRSANSGYLDATKFTKDRHSTSIALRVKAPGGMVTVTQVSIFLDKRTGVKDIPVTNSGYTVTRKVFMNAAKVWALETIKMGAKTTANGFTSNAGAGGPVDKTQTP